MEGDVASGSWDLYRNKAGFEYMETLEETLVSILFPLKRLMSCISQI